MTQAPSVPDIRITRLNESPIQQNGDYVLCWLTASRRLRWNFTLDRAIEHALKLKKPLLIFEALRSDYPWASRRLHAFVIQGMQDNLKIAKDTGHAYVPWLEHQTGQGTGLIQSLARRAAIVVTDDFPCFFLPRMIRSVARHVSVAMEAVDSNGLFPMAASNTIWPTAYAFRRFLQKNLPAHLIHMPCADPLKNRSLLKLPTLPPELQPADSSGTLQTTPQGSSGKVWTPETAESLASLDTLLTGIPIDQSVKESPITGGPAQASRTLRTFLDHRLTRYATERSDPDADVASGLSPYLHFGHISVHEVFQTLATREGWSVEQTADPRTTKGSKSGWWNMSEAAESFLDELVTWRELGFNMCHYRKDYDRYESLPDWARQTLAEHAADRRPVLYSLEQLQNGQTHDAVWNAAQNQLRIDGRMHNYLRMLWGKKILEWSPSPEESLIRMIELNNRFALDGRNPNSYSGIFWVLGRYDRPWGPERPIFGKIRYMSSDNTARKLNLDNYLQQWRSPNKG